MKANTSSEAVLQLDTSRQSGSSRRRFWQTRRFKNNVPLWVMFVPVIAFYMIFKYTPMLGLVIAFKNYTFYEGVWGSQWVGMDNFTNLFTQAQSVQIIRNTLVLSILSVLVSFPFPIALAIMLNEVRNKWFKNQSRPSSTCLTSSPGSLSAGWW